MYDNAQRCEQLCNLAFNYGSNIVKVRTESNVGVIFGNETYTFDRVECYIQMTLIFTLNYIIIITKENY